jgi:hypothetical protein
MAKGGKRAGAGNPGYGKQIAVREGVERLTPRWFAMIEEMLDSKVEDHLHKDVIKLIKELFPNNEYTAKELIKFLAVGARDDRKFALDQLGKLMGKLMPTEVTGKGGKPIEMSINLQSASTDELLRFLTAASANNIQVSG